MSELVPNGWRIHELGDLTEKIEGGGTPTRTVPEFWSGNIPWVTVKDLKKVRLSFAEESISELGLKESSSRLIPKNTLIIATRMALGKAVIFDRDVTINQDLKAIFPKKEIGVEFLLHWYLSKSEYIQGMGTGSTVKGIRLDDLRLIPIKLPPLPEQQKIAAILTVVDEVIESTQAQINKLKDLKTGLMQELLTHGIGHTDFKESPVGRIPKSWVIHKIQDVLKVIESGWSPQCESWPAMTGEWGILKTTAVSWNGFNYKENKKLPDTFEPRPQIQVNVGDVLVTRAGPLERVGVVAHVEKTSEGIMLSDKLIRLTTNEKCHSKYLALWLSGNYVQGQFSLHVSGLAQSQTNISQEIIKNPFIALPPIEEQIKIANSLQSLELRILLAGEKLEQTISTKKALMQDLLTGKVRVKTE